MRATARLARAAAALALAVLLAGCQEALHSGLAETEANQMRQALLRQGIDSDKRQGEDGTYQVAVARDDIGRALRALEAAGLPRHRFANPMELIRSDALVASPAEDRARLGYALSQELSATISSIDGVVSARVHLVLPERAAPGLGKGGAPSASVLVRHRPGYNLQGQSLAIRQLVARSVEGLAPENVSVALVAADAQPAGEPAPAAPPPAGAGLGHALLWFLAGGAAGLLLGRAPGLPAAPPLAAAAQALRQRLPAAWKR